MAGSFPAAKFLCQTEIIADPPGSFLRGKLIINGISNPLRKQGPAIELQEFFLHQPAHDITDIHRLLGVAMGSLKPVRINQRQEQMEIMLIQVEVYSAM